MVQTKNHHRNRPLKNPFFSDLTTSNGEEEESKTDETTTCDTPTPEMLPKIDFKANDTNSSPAGAAAAAEHWLRSCIKEPSSSTVLSPFVEPPIKSTTGWYEMTETSRFSEGDESIADFSVFNDSSKVELVKEKVAKFFANLA